MKQPISTEDNLTKDLDKIIRPYGVYPKELMEKLIIFIVNRDGKVLEHGIKVGKEQANAKS